MKKDIQLTNGSLVLRPCLPSDVDAMYEAVRESITELSVWMPWWLTEYSVEECRTWIASQYKRWGKGDSYSFAIIDAIDNYLLGGCGLTNKDIPLRIAELAYWVRTSRTGHGIATAAGAILAHFGFSQLELKRIEIVTAVDNVGSQRVAEKLGAFREGILRDRILVGSETRDAVMFSLIIQDVARLQGLTTSTK